MIIWLGEIKAFIKATKNCNSLQKFTANFIDLERHVKQAVPQPMRILDSQIGCKSKGYKSYGSLLLTEQMIKTIQISVVMYLCGCVRLLIHMPENT